MTVRTKQLASGVLGTSSAGYYTCPAGKTAIIKQITLNNPAGGAATIATVTVDTVSGQRVIVRESMNAPSVVRIGELFIVLAPGDDILASNSVASGTGLMISGTELDGVAP